jgi:hypothetical protein
MANSNPISRGPGIVSQALHSLVSQIPASLEAPSANPGERVKSLAKKAALKAATLSGSFTLPPGPFGMATVIPDLLAVWRIQQQLVADIAGVFGKTSTLTPETMVICLFRHGGAALTRGLFAHEGTEVRIQRITNRTLLQLLEKIAIRVAQRVAAKSVSRWLPIVGALGAGAYAYYDTTHVATNAINLFSGDLRIEGDAAGENSPTTPRQARSANGSKPSASTKPRRTRKSNGKRSTRPRRPRTDRE